MPSDFRSRIASAVAALMGISAYATPYTKTSGLALDSEQVEQIRETQGGQIQPIPTPHPRWYMADLEVIEMQTERGEMAMAGKLWRSMKRDGWILGLSETLCAGLVSLPKRFRGDQELIQELSAETDSRSIFDEMFPVSELALLAADRKALGIAVAELVPVVGRDYPVLVRLDPEFLWYRWNEGRWYYQSIAGSLPITPGDGRWLLWTAGRMNPWQAGLWKALGRAFITKEHAILHRANYSAKLANPARVAHAAAGATEDLRTGFFAKLAAWGLNTVFELPPGWEVELLESNGRGWEVFSEEIDGANTEIMIALAGQTVTVDGGSGFSNADIHRVIRADLIERLGAELSYLINTQGIPAWIVSRYGEAALSRQVAVSWDVSRPAEMKDEAETFKALGEAVSSLEDAGITPDRKELCSRFGLPALAFTDGKSQTTTAAEAKGAADVETAEVKSEAAIPAGNGNSGNGAPSSSP